MLAEGAGELGAAGGAGAVGHLDPALARGDHARGDHRQLRCGGEPGADLALDQVVGNYLDPRLQGRALNISSLVVLVSVIFWGWIWGVAGTLLAVPMTATIMIACSHVPALRPIAILMQGGVRRDTAEREHG